MHSCRTREQGRSSMKFGVNHSAPIRASRIFGLLTNLRAVLFLFPVAFGCFAQGIPEPGLIMYGVVRNTNSGANVMWNFGSLTWTLRPAGGQPITLSAVLTNINDQFCYLLQ